MPLKALNVAMGVPYIGSETGRFDAGPVGRIPALAAWVVPSIATATVLVIFAGWFSIHATPGDAYNYLAAGERLNAGHQLYALSPGDRVVEIRPPYWSVPLLSPPFIAVLWRPLAALPGELGVAVWWSGGLVVMAGTLIAMAVRRPVLVGLAVLSLSIPVTYELGMGNVNMYLFGGVIATWLLWRGGRPEFSAVLVGLMIVLKLTPAMFAVWLLAVTPRRPVVLALVATVGVCLAIGAVGAGAAASVEYVGIVASAEAGGASRASLGGITGIQWMPTAFAGATALAAVMLRSRPGVSFAVATVGWVLGSPAVYMNSFADLIAALAPVAWRGDSVVWTRGSQRQGLVATRVGERQ